MPSSRLNGHFPWYLTAFKGRAASVALRARSAARADSRSHMQWYLHMPGTERGRGSISHAAPGKFYTTVERTQEGVNILAVIDHCSCAMSEGPYGSHLLLDAAEHSGGGRL